MSDIVQFPDLPLRLLRWLGRCLLLASLAAAPALAQPATYEEVANRVFVRTAPNGSIQLFRPLADHRFEPVGAYRTNRVDYVRDAVDPNKAVLTFGSTDVFSGKPAWVTNRFLLTFTSPTNGTYELEFTISTVPGIQRQAGPFEISAGPNIAPRIWQQPESFRALAGNSPALSVNAAGFELAYQWFREGELLTGETKVSLTLRNFGPAQVGNYHVIVRNPLGSVTSAVARVELLTPPVITAPPQPVRALVGENVSFRVQAAGDELVYDWFLNGRSSGRASPDGILNLTNVTTQLEGPWFVVVQNNAGAVTSAPVRLTLCANALDTAFNGRPWVKLFATEDPLPGTPNRLGPFKTPFEPIFTLWNQTVHATARANNNEENPAVLQNTLLRWQEGEITPLVFTNDPVPGAANGEHFVYPFYPTDEGDGAVNFAFHDMFELRGGTVTSVLNTNTPAPGRPGYTFFGPGSFARRGDGVVISATLRGPDGAQGGSGVYLRKGSTLTRIADNTADLPGVLTGYGGRLSEDSVNFDGTTVVFSTMESINGPGGVFRATLDGTVTKLLDTGDKLPGFTNDIVRFGDVDVEGGLVFAVVGLRVAGSSANRVVAFEADGTPRVIAQADYLVAGGPRQVYYGSSGFIARWTDGVTESLLNSASVFDCRRAKRFFDVEAQGDDITVGVEFTDGTIGVWGCFGAQTTGAPRILAQPEPQSGRETVPVSFGVAATGAAPLGYQWRHNGQPLAGATQAVFTVLSPGPADLGNYDVIISNATGSVTSTAAALTLGAPPVKPVVFGVLPGQTVAIPVGGSADLSMIVAGAPPLTFQWRKAQQPIPGATALTLNLRDVTTNNHGLHDLVIGNAAGAVTNAINVSIVPLVTGQPRSVTVAPGGTARFEVAATGFAQYRYIWLKDGNGLTGQTNAVLELPNVSTADAGSYQVLVIGVGGGSVRSENGVLTVSGGGGPDPGVFRLANFTASPAGLRFELPTVSGISYRVEVSGQIGTPEWSTVQTVTGDGTTKTVEVPVGGDAAFVRVSAP